METVCRRGMLDDSAEIARLSDQLGYPAETDQIRERLRKILDCSDHVFIVAEAEGRLLGWIHAHGRYLVETPPFVEIGGLVVDAEYRGQAIGTHLMERMEEWANANGFQQVRVRSKESRTQAHQFYQKRGYDKVKVQHVLCKTISSDR